MTLIFSWLIAIPLGIYTAVRRNGFTDAVASFIGYIVSLFLTFWLHYSSSRSC